MPDDRFKSILQRLTLSSAENRRRLRDVDNPSAQTGYKDIDNIRLSQDVSAWTQDESMHDSLSGLATERKSTARTRAILEIDNPILKKALVDSSREAMKVAKKMIELSPKRVRTKSKEAMKKKKTFINVVAMHDYAEMN